jgi:hypothetical protein
MTDEHEMVRIWLGTQNIPPIQVYAPKVLTPEHMLMLLKMSLGVEMQRTWFDGSVMNLKGGEEFVVNTEKGFLHKGFLETYDAIQDLSLTYLNTWEVAEALDPADAQAELAVHAVNDSDGYWQETTIVPLGKPIQDIGEIWSEVGRRIRTEQTLFALVRNNTYLPRRGKLDQPIQSVEVKFGGKASRKSNGLNLDQAGKSRPIQMHIASMGAH